MNAMREFTELPVLDLSLMRSGSEEDARRFGDELRAASRDVGFFYLTGHGLDPVLFSDLLDAAMRFFALPLESKMDVYIGKSTNHRGYVPEGEEVFAGGTKDLKEAFDLCIDLPDDDPRYLAGNPLLGPNQWPPLDGFREAAQAYYDQAFEVGRLLIRGLARALDMAPDAFDGYLTAPPSQLRMVHYPFNPDAVDVMGVGAHTDYECFTLLHATGPGLEVLNGAGQWIDAPPTPGALTINIGDMTEILSNGVFVATAHRVRKVTEERYSFPLFFTLDYDTAVAPVDRFVTEDRPARSGLVAGEHLFAQTAQSFSYQKVRLAKGEITLPDRAVGLSSFGQPALREPT